MPDDPIDRLTDQWRRERPDLDPAPMALMARLFRVSRAADRAVDAGLAEHGLQPGWFDVLSALRRAGSPHRLSPGRLSAAVMLSTGGMTKRLDRMEAAGLLERSADPDDRRGVLVGLTARGRRAVDAAVEAHIANEARMLAGLSARDQAQLERLLRKLDASIAAATGSSAAA
jgi:DNA-binding MarR family transcriptional regulator